MKVGIADLYRQTAGEKVLAAAQLPEVRPGRWHTLMLRFEGTTLTGFVDGREVLTVTDERYARGMAGLLARVTEGKKMSTPYYDDVVIKPVGAPTPKPATAAPGQRPLY